jgi:hypothetical protein
MCRFVISPTKTVVSKKTSIERSTEVKVPLLLLLRLMSRSTITANANYPNSLIQLLFRHFQRSISSSTQFAYYQNYT